MVKYGHIDKDIVKFMLDSKIYLKFANNYLNKSQIDDITIKI